MKALARIILAIGNVVGCQGFKKMDRFILRYTGSGAMPPADLEKIHQAADVTVVDETPRMVLVEAPSESAAHLADLSPEWSCSRERMLPLPSTRKRTR